jgi:hypothetical protein
MSRVTREMVVGARRKVEQSKKSKKSPHHQSTYLYLLYDYHISAMIAPHYGATRLACWFSGCVGLVHWS